MITALEKRKLIKIAIGEERAGGEGAGVGWESSCVACNFFLVLFACFFPVFPYN